MPHEETRKIIKVGETSFAVILPKSWLRYYGLTDKDKVLVVSNGAVTIKPSAEPIRKESGKCARIRRRIDMEG